MNVLRYVPLFAFVLVLPLTLTACGGDDVAENQPAAAEPTQETVEVPEQASTEVRLEDGVQVVEVTAGPRGYAPERINLKAGVPARLIFTRTTPSSCLEQVQVPALDIQKTHLPMNEQMAIEFTPKKSGTFTFVCGMDMQHGTIVVSS